MDSLDQIYYFWALANGFEKYMFPGDYICSKNIQKMYHALIHAVVIVWKSFANGNRQQSESISVHLKGEFLKTRFEKEGGGGVSFNLKKKMSKRITISLDHNTYNIQPGFEHFIPVPTRFFRSKSTNYERFC